MRKFFVERYWVGRSFCFSRIIDEDGIELRGYKWYGGRKPAKDSMLHRQIDYVARDILKEATGKTTGSAFIDATIVVEKLKSWYEDCGWDKKNSYRILIINKWLDEYEKQIRYP